MKLKKRDNVKEKHAKESVKLIRIKQFLTVIALVITVIAIQFGISKYLLNTKEETNVTFFEYRIAETEIVISPETYTGEEVTVTITTQKSGLSIQYQLGDDGEWVDYTGSFSVDDNVKVNTRLVSEEDNFEGPITEKEIKNIAVAKIGDTYYKTLAEAIEACAENAGNTQTKIEMLTNTTESIVIPEGKNIVLDLCGATLKNAENTDATITVNGTLNLIDSAQNEDGSLQGNGKVTSTTAAIKVTQTGNFTLGTNESGTNVSVSIENPAIVAETYGVVIEEGGIFNFYDGKISGKTNAINGTVAAKPENYDVQTSEDGEYEVAILKTIHTVTFDKNADNATVEFESVVKYTGDKIEKLPTAQREGYELKGWFTEKENGTQVTVETVVSENITYYAQWEANKYTIQYNANGGNGTTNSTQAVYDTEVTVAENTFTAPEGYTFKEWNTMADGNGIAYQVGDKLLNLTSEKDGIVNLYAIWEDTIAPTTTAPTGTGTTNTITVNCNQADNGTGINEATVEYAIFNKDTNSDGTPDSWSDWQTSNIFAGLSANTEYQVKTRATDNNGNGPVESEIGKISTSTIENGSVTIHKDTATGEIITPETSSENKDNQINNNIYLDITASTTGTTTLTVKTPLGETNTYTDDTTITTQTGTYEITIETTDGTNTVTDTYYVVVDKTLPTANPTSSKTTNSITVNANAEDEHSGIKEVTYTIKDGNTIIETNATGEFKGLEDGKEFTVEMQITDKAGNKTVTTEVISTEKLVAGSLTFEELTTSTPFTPNTVQPTNSEEKIWVNENVSLELTQGNAGTTSYEVTAPDGTKTTHTSDTQITTIDGEYIITVTTTDGTNTETVTYYFNVDKILPTVTINPNTQEYTIAVGNNMATIGTTLTAIDETNGSGVTTTKYAWSESNTEEPESWSDFTSGTEVTTSVQGGTYYLWTNVIDKAGNKATSVKVSGKFNVGYAVEYDLNGGTGTIESQRKEHGVDLSLAKTIPTKEGYIFKGWATSQDATEAEYTVTENSSTLYTKDESVRLYAVWSEVVASTTINGTTTNYDSVQGAITAAGTNSGAIVTLIKDNIQENVTVAAGQNIVLDLNGKTLTFTGNTITNNGTLEVKDSSASGTGTLGSTATRIDAGESAYYIINNYGDLTLTNGTLSSTTTGGIYNKSTGIVEVLDGTIHTYGQAIRNGGISTSETEPSVIIAGGELQSTLNTIVNGSVGLVHITGGTISSENSGSRPTILMGEAGTIKIDGGTIIAEADRAITMWNESGSEINGKVQINGGTVTGVTAITSTIGGTIEITGGTVTGTAVGIDSKLGNVIITGGKVTGDTVAVKKTQGTLTIGNNADAVSTAVPEIVATQKGVQVAANTTFNFYDGIITGSVDNSIDGTVNNTPDGYRVVNGIETIESTTYETSYLNNVYHIIFDDNCTNGSTQTLDITYNSKLGTLPTPIGTVQGYTFSGWYTEKTAGTQITAETLVTKDITYYAHWEPNQDTEYTVYHYRENANDTGYELVQTQYLQGETDSLIMTPDLSKAGEGELANCRLGKATLKENGIAEMSTTIAPDGSTKIYMFYLRNTFELQVTAGQNINTVTGSGTYKWGQTVNLTAEVESLEGYNYSNFVWSTTTENINIEEIVTDKTQTQTTLTMPAKATQVTATSDRTPIVYNLTYNLDGGKLADGETNPSTYTVEDEITLKSATKQGYTFIGWKLSTLNGENVDNSTATTTIPAGTTGNREYTAVYSSAEVSYTVYHYLENANDSNYTLYNTEVKEAKTNDVITLDSSLAIEITNATYSKSTQTEGGAQGTTITVAADSSSKIYVYYTRNTYVLNIVAGDNITKTTINSEEKAEGTFKYGQTINISATIANLSGYIYDGFRWETTNTSILGSTTSQNTTVTMPAENVTVTAVANRVAIPYVIEYTLDGGIVNGENPTKYTVESPTLTIINPEKTGYTFLGWTGTGISTPTKNLSIPQGTTGHRYYTANWEINKYTVTYDYGTNGGASSTDSSIKTEDVKVDYNSTIDLSKTASKENYTFIGWNTDANATTAIDSLIMGTENVTLYAIYAKDVTITYNANGGSTDITQTHTMYNTNTSLEITLPAPTTFVGWTFNGYGETSASTSGDAQGTTKTITIAENTTEVNYYHTWKKVVTFNSNKPETADENYNVEMAETTREIYYNNKFGTLPADPTLVGWTFDGWFTAANNGTKITSETLSQEVTENIYAQWTLSATMNINPEEVTLDLSQNITQAIAVTGSNYGTVSFETKDNTVATVSETGIITAVSNGTTQITVIGSNGQITKTVEVTVITTPINIEISQDTALIGVVSNNTVALYTTINPQTANSKNTVTWSSNNPSVATVNATTGVVTGVAEGIAIITAATENGCTDTCEITVDGTAPTVEVAIDNTDYEQTHTATITIADSTSGLPANQEISYAWSTSKDTAPSEWQTKTITTTVGTKNITTTIDAPSGVTGTYYLWIKSGIQDRFANSTIVNYINESAIAKIDVTNPVIELNGTSNPTKASANSNITIPLKITELHSGMNTTGTTADCLTADDIIVKVAGTQVTPTTKELVYNSVSDGVYSYTLNLSGVEGSGELTIEIAEEAIQDKAGNYNSAVTLNTGVTMDSTSFSATITANVTSPTNAPSVIYTFTFNKKAVDFTASDISILNDSEIYKGTIGTFTKVSDTVYTLELESDGSYYRYISIGGCTDEYGNTLSPVEMFETIIDLKAPTAVGVEVKAESETGTVKGTVAAGGTGTIYTGTANTYLTFAATDAETQVVGYKVATSANSDFGSLETVDSYNFTATAEGNTYYIKALDQAGNLSENATVVIVKLVTLAINPETMSIENEKTGSLTATSANAGTITWTSSDDTIATVSSTGAVTAKKVGTVTITATASTDATVKDTAAITVTKGIVEIPTAVTGLEYNGTTQTGVVAGSDKYTLTGNTAVNGGSYNAIAALKDPTNYQWSDGTTANKTIAWEIAQATRNIEVSTNALYVGVGVEKEVTFTYTGVEGSDVTATVATGTTGIASTTIVDGNMSGTVKVTGATAGTTTVTITVPADENYEEVSAQVNVVVTDFTLNPTSAVITKNEQLTITPTITPASAANDANMSVISWSSSNDDYAVVSSSSTTKGGAVTVTGVAHGVATITATLNGQSKTVEVDVQVNYESITPPPTLAEVVEVGDYVNYDASSNGVKTFTSSDCLTGSSVSATISTEEDFNSDAVAQWRVLSVDKESGIVELMAVDPTTKTVTLSGGDGFLNAETVLNNVGAIYGKGKGATGGRSITAEDINQYSSYVPSTGSTRRYTSGKFYKEIKDESGNVTGYETRTTVASSSNSVTMTHTYYSYYASSYFSNSTMYNMIFKNSTRTSTNKSDYWLASRSVELNSKYAYFSVRYVYGGYLGNYYLYASGGSTNSCAYGVVPVVSLESNIQTMGQDSNGVWQLKLEDVGAETSTYYATLSEALQDSATGSTIKALNGITETTAPILSSDKTITLDLNGKTTTLNGVTLTNNGNLTIIGDSGELKSTTTAITNNGTLTLGTNEETPSVSTIAPAITGSTGIDNSNTNSTLNFYDGIVKGTSGTSINGEVTITPTNYIVNKTTTDGTETAILQQQYIITYDANGGSNAPASQVKNYDEDIQLTKETPTHTTYVFAGWATTSDATTPEYLAGATYSENASITLYAVWVDAVASTTINGVTTVYETVQEAINAAGTNSGATVTLLKETITESVTVADTQNIILNLNGNTLTYKNAVTLTNNGTLTIEGDGALTGNGASGVYPITNKGTLIKNGPSTLASTTAASSSTVQYIINNTQTGTVVINEGTLTSNDRGIYNAGSTNNASLTINGGTLTTTDYAIYNGSGLSTEENPSVKISNAQITSNSGDAIFNDGSGMVVVENSTVTASTYGIHSDNSGTLIIKDSSITSTTSWGICNSSNGTVNVYNSDITGYVHGLGNASAASGTLNIYSGNIIGETNDGIAVGKGTVTLGTDDGIISVTNPKVQGKRYGLNINSTSGKVYFYDGIIISTSSTSIYGGTVTGKPANAVVQTTSNSTGGQDSILVGAYAEYDTSGDVVQGYNTLALASENAISGNTIKVMASLTETIVPTIAESKTIILDLNSKTITLNELALTNNGTLTIKDTSSAGTGTINRTAATQNVTIGTISNSGKIVVESGTVSSEAVGIINTSTGQLEVTNGTISTSFMGICNNGTSTDENSPAVKISGGIISVSSTAPAIYGSGNGLVYIADGNMSSSGICVSGTNLKIVDGTISGGGNSPAVGVTTNLEMSGGTVSSSYQAINLANGATATITGGTINCTSGTYGAIVVNKNSTLTLGTDDGTISTTVPSITGDEYGVQTVDGGTFNFYDGIIAGPAGNSIYGTVADIPDDCAIANGSKTINSTVYETSYLATSSIVTFDDNCTEGSTQTVEVKYGEQLGTLPTPTIVPEGYAFGGWYTTTSGGTKISETTTVTGNATFYAGWVEAVYGEYTSTGNYVTGYVTLASAMTGVTSGNTIKAINSVTETTAPTLATGKTAKLDLNGQTITMSSVALTNNGTLEITDTSSGAAGKMTITGSNLIQNYSILTITNGTLSANSATIANQEQGRVIVNGGTITASSIAINSVSTITTESDPAVKITGGTIKVSTPSPAVYSTSADGLIYMSGGTISSYILGINSKNAIITGGEIIATGNQAPALAVTSNLTMTNGTVTSNGHSAVNLGSSTTAIITGGTITSKSTGYAAIQLNAGSTLTLGTDDGTVSTTVPSVTGNVYGIYIPEGATFNFYDGIAAGKDSINGVIADVPDGYGVVNGTTTIDSVTYETSYLEEAAIVTFDDNCTGGSTQTISLQTGSQIGTLPMPTTTPDGYICTGWYTAQTGGTQITETTTVSTSMTVYAQWITGNYVEVASTGFAINVYDTLAQATAGSTSGNTIKAMQTLTETTAITVDSGKTLTFDLNGQTTTIDAVKLTNNGTLTITDTVGTGQFVEKGTTGNPTTTPLYNYGKLTFKDLTVTSNISAVYNEASGRVVVDNAIINGSFMTIYNAGTSTDESDPSFKMISGEMTATISGPPCINNCGNGLVYIQDGTITSGGSAISGGKVKITGGTLNVNGTTAAGISLSGNGSLEMTGGTINASFSAVNLTASTAIITGGTLNATGTMNAGISVNATSTLTLGTNDGTVSTTSPSIVGAKQGIYVVEGGTFNYYDGIIKGPSGLSINGAVAELATDYCIVNGTETINGTEYETSYLEEIDYYITYNDNCTGGSTTTIGYAGNYAIGTLPEPTVSRDGYAFNGWYTAASGGTEITESTVVTSNLTVYAQWLTGTYAEENSSGKTVNVYDTLAAATSGATSGNTIIALEDATETTAATVDSTKTLTLDLNGKTVAINSVKLTNNGTLTITDLSDAGSGTLSLTGTMGNPTGAPLANYGKITLGKITVSSNASVVNNQAAGRVVIAGAEITSGFIPIYNIGTSQDESDPSFKMTSGTITCTNTTPAINTTSDGLLYITGGSITSVGLAVSGGNLKITGGTFTGTNTNMPTVASSKTIQISNGTFNGTYGALNIGSGGVATVTGGTFNGTSGTYGAIYVQASGTLTLGTNNSSVNKTTPSITGTKYGIQIADEGTFNFYDGIIRGSSGGSIFGTVAATPTNYRVANGTATVNGTTYETSYLDNTYYVTFDDNCDNGGTTVVGVTYNKQIGTLPEPTTSPASTQTGYMFDGWYTQAEGGTKITTSTVVTADITYYAHWRNYYLSEVGVIGEYVNYDATDNGTYTYTTNSSLTGSSTSSTFSSSDTMSWRILSINEQEGTVELMSADATESTVTFNGSTAWINAVDVLNDIGGIYAHGTGAVSGRSMALEDIQGYSSYNLADYENVNGYVIGDTEQYTSGTFINSNGSFVEASESNVIVAEQTAYTYKEAANYFAEDMFTLFFRDSADTENKSYWLANTSTFLDSAKVNYEIRRINSSAGVSHREVYSSAPSDNEGTEKVVPVVKLYATVTVTGKDENGAWNITFDSTREAEYSSSNISSIGENEINNSANSLLQNGNMTSTNNITSIQGGNLTNNMTSTNIQNSMNGSTITEIEDVVEIEQNVQIGEEYYETLTEALNAAVDGDTIKILNDISLEQTITNDKNITLNLNGKTISSTQVNTITNNGTLTITGTGIVRNDIENGSVIYNNGTLNIENGVITSNANGNKAVYNDSGVVNMNSGKIVTEGISGIGIYNINSGKVTINDGIIEVTGTSSRCIYNDAELEINGGDIIVSGDDSIGIYNLDKATKCVINNVEILVEAEVIENYEEIKNTDEFKVELEAMKSSYGIYNNSSIEVEIQTATIKVERLKGVGIMNNSNGTITLGTEDSDVNLATPIIYAIADNTTAISNSENGVVNFYDGRIVTLTSIKQVITKVLTGYEIIEEIGESVLNATLKLIEVVEVVEEENNSEEEIVQDEITEDEVIEEEIIEEDSNSDEEVVEETQAESSTNEENTEENSVETGSQGVEVNNEEVSTPEGENNENLTTEE